MKNKISLFGLLILLFLLSSSSSAVWTILESGGGITGLNHNSLELLSDGTPCYLYGLGFALYYECYYAGVGFVGYPVTANYGGSGIFALAIDNNDVPHVCWSDGGSVFYAKKVGVSFVVDTNFTTGGVTCAIDTDVNNNPHIVYQFITTYEKFKTLAGTWSTNAITSEMPYFYGKNIRISQDNYKYIYLSDGFKDAHRLRLYNITPYDLTTYTSYHHRVDGYHMGDMEIYNNKVYLYDSGVRVQSPIHSNNFPSWEKIVSIDDVGGSISLYQGNVFVSYSKNNNLYINENSSGSFSASIIDSASSLYLPTIAIDQSTGRKWIVYTSSSNTIKLAYEDQLCSIYGRILDGVTGREVDTSVYVNYKNLLTGVEQGAYTNVLDGSYSIANMVSGIYNVTLTDVLFQTYVNKKIANVVVSCASPEMNWVMYPKTYATNLSLVQLTFLDLYTNEPKPNLNVQFEYVDCLAGCPSCCVARGNKYYGVTNLQGRVTKDLLQGVYAVSILGNYNIWDDVEHRLTNIYYISVETPTYSKVLSVKDINRTTFSLSGKVYDSETMLPLENATIVLLNKDRTAYYQDTTNISGDYKVSHIAVDIYDIAVTRKDYQNYYQLGYIIPCREYDFIVNCTLNFYLVSSIAKTYFINGTIKDLDDGTLIPNVNLTLFSITKPFFITINSANGIYKFSNLTNGEYYLRVQRGGYEFYCPDCVINNNIKHKVFTIKNADIKDYTLYMQNISKIRYYCLNGTITYNTTPINNALITIKPNEKFLPTEEGYFTEKIDYTDINGVYEVCGLRNEKCFSIKIKHPLYEEYTDTFCIENSDKTKNYVLTPLIEQFYMDFWVYNCRNYNPLSANIYAYNYYDTNRTNILYNFFVEDKLKDFKIAKGYYTFVAYPTISGYETKAEKSVQINDDGLIEICFREVAGFKYLNLIAYKDEDLRTPLGDILFIVKNLQTNERFQQKTSSVTGNAQFYLPDISNYMIDYVPTGNYILSPISPTKLPFSTALKMDLTYKFSFVLKNETKEGQPIQSLDVYSQNLMVLIQPILIIFLILILIKGLNSVFSQ